MNRVMKSMLLTTSSMFDLRMRCQAQLPHRRTVLTSKSGLSPGAWRETELFDGQKRAPYRGRSGAAD